MARGRTPQWVTTLLFLAFVAVMLWSRTPPPERPPAPAVPVESQPPTSRPLPSRTADEAATETALVVRRVTIKNQSGRVVYRGDVDLAPTLDRIERGERHPHRNDGGTFRNLEGRLPKKPTGYYKEYVHPTEELDGPGPQRVILGRDGDVWYTADHYQSFKRIR
jgi:filamentous hemagglutinin